MKNKENSLASAVIVAAGNSSRMKMDGSKQFLMISGIPVLARTLLAFDRAANIADVTLVTREQDMMLIWDMVREYQIKKVTSVVPGGSFRQESVFIGLCEAREERVLIHDGARPLIAAEEIESVVRALDHCRAAALGVAVKDTIKEVDENGTVIRTVPRERLVQMQTPQGFYTKEIIEAHKRAQREQMAVTDDCALFEFLHIPVQVLPGRYQNIKITTPEDIALAEVLLGQNESNED